MAMCWPLQREVEMPELNSNPRLKDFQKYVSELEIERGFYHQNAIEKALLLGEEVGELFKAIRKAQNLGIDSKSQVCNISEELADVFIYICSIANRYGVDLEKALIEKEDVNKKRVWVKDQDK